MRFHNEYPNQIQVFIRVLIFRSDHLKFDLFNLKDEMQNFMQAFIFMQ